MTQPKPAKARSAKGLFRATGKKPKQISLKLGDGIVKIDGGLPRKKNDFYPTPPEPIRAYLKAEIHRLKEFEKIWEPAAGDGAMIREFERAGLRAYASDIIDRGCGAEIKSFYDYKKPVLPAIVTNPPFKECNSNHGWVRYALEVLNVEYMALLLPLNWVGSNHERLRLWVDHPPARMFVMRWRIDFTNQGNPPIYYAWYVWDTKAEIKGQTLLYTIDQWDDVNQMTFLSTAEALR